MKLKRLTASALNLIFLGILCSQISGCDIYMLGPLNVTNNPKYKSDFAKGQIYLIKQPLFLMTDRGSNDLYVDTGQPHLPRTREEYLAETNRWPEIGGLVEARTKISILKITRMDTFENGPEFYTYAVVLDGHFTGQIVDISLICDTKRKYPYVPAVIPQFLELENGTNIVK